MCLCVRDRVSVRERDLAIFQRRSEAPLFALDHVYVCVRKRERVCVREIECVSVSVGESVRQCV